MLIFVCCPVTPEKEDKYLTATIWENQQNAYEYTKEVLETGNAPLTPQLFIPDYSDKTMLEDERLLKAVLQMIKKCDDIWVFGSILTQSMKLQLQYAVENSLHIKFIAE